jgi:hypothetical protein
MKGKGMWASIAYCIAFCMKEKEKDADECTGGVRGEEPAGRYGQPSYP